MDTSLQICRVPLGTLVPDPANPRRHGEANLAAIRASLQRFHQAEPIVTQAGTRRVIAGHGRLEAMRSLGWTECDIVELEVDETTATALGIALNRTGELATWDDSALSALLASLPSLDGTGFSLADLDELIGAAPYQYAHRNPLRWGDPSGLAPIEHDGPEGQGRVAFDSRYWDIGAETFGGLLNEWLDNGGGREAVAERFGHLISDEKYLETLSPAELVMVAATFLDLPDGAMTTEQEGNFKRDLASYYAVAKAAARTQQAIAYTISGFADPTGALIESAAESIDVSPELLDRIRSVKDASALLRGNVIGALKNGMRGAHSQVLSVAGEGAKQYKRITDSEIRRWKKKFGFDAHRLKPNSKYDLFKDKHGNIIVKPIDGRGPGELSGYNIDEFR